MFHAAFQRLSDPSTGFSGARAFAVVADAGLIYAGPPPASAPPAKRR
jgi:hypothetical protein